MAESPSHRFGQIIGNLLEEILLPVLLKFCDERGLYLDRHGERKNVRKGAKVNWEDKYGNAHDLDFVIEKDGAVEKRGRPVAFIEAAWRRYTKHSRNKAQEIQGAILPIAEKYECDQPFLGAVLAGVFTKGSLDQLKSVGFDVVYLPYETIVEAFKAVGINASFDEETADREFARCICQIESLTNPKRDALKQHLFDANGKIFQDFFTSLRKKLDRVIKRVVVLPLFGDSNTFSSIGEALQFIDGFKADKVAGDFQKYEVIVVFSNNDEIKGTFTSKERVKEFLDYVSA
jgi:hypothetical protein